MRDDAEIRRALVSSLLRAHNEGKRGPRIRTIERETREQKAEETYKPLQKRPTNKTEQRLIEKIIKPKKAMGRTHGFSEEVRRVTKKKKTIRPLMHP